MVGNIMKRESVNMSDLKRESFMNKGGDGNKDLNTLIVFEAFA